MSLCCLLEASKNEVAISFSAILRNLSPVGNLYFVLKVSEHMSFVSVRLF